MLLTAPLGFNIDTFVLLLNLTVFRPLLSLSYLLLYVSWRRGIFDVPPIFDDWFQSHQSVAWSLAIFSLSVVTFNLSNYLSYWVSNRSSLAPLRSKADWNRELVVITGGASGIGAQLAQRCAQRGCKVVTLDVRPSSSSNPSSSSQPGRGGHHGRHPETDGKRGSDDPSTSSPPSPLHPNIHPYICDVSKRDQVIQVSEVILSRFGTPPTILINNAGTFNRGKLVTEIDQNELSNVMGVNLLSNFWTLQSFLPAMIRLGRGHVVTVSSVMAHFGVSRMTDYVSTKHALVGLHESLRLELDKKFQTPNVRTTLVVLGHVKTRLFTGMRFNPLANFLAPSVEVDLVAESILQSLERRENSVVYLPFYSRWVVLLKVVPIWLRDLIQIVMGADESLPSKD
ncbi:NAD(P)-binding protein [Violaceomyces palustris]|uniref:NAD(P)-binding protein n=1 Tax=Violaceomyces palustris TaxID=1673888 RepID=A0ACD0P2S2_9BASI|nr:NAD(P)-binding protein [Violaceomyces palustris]